MNNPPKNDFLNHFRGIVMFYLIIFVNPGFSICCISWIHSLHNLSASFSFALISNYSTLLECIRFLRYLALFSAWCSNVSAHFFHRSYSDRDLTIFYGFHLTVSYIFLIGITFIRTYFIDVCIAVTFIGICALCTVCRYIFCILILLTLSCTRCFLCCRCPTCSDRCSCHHNS